MKPMQINNGVYSLTNPLRWGARSLTKFTQDEIREAANFAWRMAFGAGEHRNHRSGGKQTRPDALIFRDTFQGKLAEFGFASLLQARGMTASVDTSVHDLGIWDSCDFELHGKKIAVKSTKRYGNLLLLEEADWEAPNLYLPGDGKGSTSYDAVVLIRIDPEVSSFIPSGAGKDEVRQRVSDAIQTMAWNFDVPGYLGTAQLAEMLGSQTYVIPEGSILGAKTKMDATNFYCQTGDLIPIGELFSSLNP